MNTNNANIHSDIHVNTEDACVVKNVGQQLKNGWSSCDAMLEDNLDVFFNDEHHLEGISVDHLEYIYPVVYGNGSMLLKTPIQLLIEAENFIAAEILLNKGVSLPDYIKDGFFEVSELESYLSYLSQCSYDLFIEYHQLKDIETQNRCQEMNALKNTTKQNARFISEESPKKSKATHVLQIKADDLLSMIRDKHADTISGKLKKWLDTKIGFNDSLSLGAK